MQHYILYSAAANHHNRQVPCTSIPAVPGKSKRPGKNKITYHRSFEKSAYFTQKASAFFGVLFCNLFERPIALYGIYGCYYQITYNILWYIGLTLPGRCGKINTLAKIMERFWCGVSTRQLLLR
jgi:hypothetical protein